MPATHFGPWTTALDDGSCLELSAFWQSRMTRLSTVAARADRLTAHHRCLVGCAATLLALAPQCERPALSEPGGLESPSANRDVVTSPTPSIDAAAIAKRERVLRLLDAPTTANFGAITISDALRRLAEIHKIDLRFDVDQIRNVGRSLDIAATSVSFSGITLQSALKLILEPEALGYYVERETLVITSRGNAWLTKTDYDIRPLVRSGIPSKQFADAVRYLIAPESWDTGGGGGSLGVDELTLQVVQRREIHQIIHRFIDSMLQLDHSLSGPLETGSTAERRYSVSELRSQGTSDELLIGSIRGTLIHALKVDRAADAKTEIHAALQADELVVTNQTEWGHAVTTTYLAELRDLRSHTPLLPLEIADFQRAARGIEEEARRRMLLRRLKRQITVEFANTPLRDALRSLAFRGEFNLLFDPSAAARASTTGITLVATDETLSGVLDRVCAQAELAWSVEDEIVKMTSTDIHSPIRVPRAHSTKDVIAIVDADREIARTIVKEIAPHTWGDETGKGRIYAVPGAILVMHNEAVQRLIKNWLESHRKK